MKFQEIVENLKIGDKLLLLDNEVAEVMPHEDHCDLPVIKFKCNLRTADFYINEGWVVIRTTIITEIKGLWK